jgi:hypothetical protein
MFLLAHIHHQYLQTTNKSVQLRLVLSSIIIVM